MITTITLHVQHSTLAFYSDPIHDEGEESGNDETECISEYEHDESDHDEGMTHRFYLNVYSTRYL